MSKQTKHYRGYSRLLRAVAILQLFALLGSSMLAAFPPTLPQLFSPLQPLLGETKVAQAAGSVTGTVFRDFNSDGVQGPHELGVAGVTVTAYDAQGVSQGTATTGANGDYTLTAGGTGPYRIEFTDLPEGYEPSTHGPDNGTSVQFVLDGTSTDINLGVNYPADYCQDNPLLCTPIHVNGDINTTAPTHAMFRFEEDDRGGSPAPTQIADKAEIGSTWGVAYNRSSGVLYTSAFLKRHVGLGPDGLGAIYQIPNANETAGTPSLFIDVTTIAGVDVGTIGSNTARGLGAPGTPNNDPDAFDAVGKIGLGDIDISDDSSTLYAVNLNERTLLEIPIDNPTNLVEHAIPTNACTGGEARPFATKYYRGDLYVGMVCDGTSSDRTNLEALVYRFDPSAATFSSVLQFPLTYARGQVAGCGVTTIDNQWNAWINVPGPEVDCFGGTQAYPQPLLSDIEFDVDGSMILAFTDRWGHQVGYINRSITGVGTPENGVAGGDILRAYNNNGTFELENNGSAGPLTSAGVGNLEGPGDGEFYVGDRQLVLGTDHQEIANGGLALRPGSGRVASTAIDAIGEIYTAGVRYFSNTDGSAAVADSHRLYVNNAINTFGKGNGLGDLELLCDEAPIEIGNRVWHDLNENGIQDPGEPGLDGAIVSLQTPTTTLTVTTDLNGNYYFGNLQPHTTYTITIDPLQPLLWGFGLTTPNAEGDTSNDNIEDVRDSDAALDGRIPTIVYTTGNAGENNHGLDFGFIEVPVYDLALIKKLAAGQPALVLAGSTVNYEIAVYNQGTAPSGAFTVTEQIPAGMSFVSANGPDFTCSEAGGVATCGYTADLLTGQSAVIALSLEVTDTSQAPFRNWAEISDDSGDDVDSTPDTDTGNDDGPGTGTPPNDAAVNHNDPHYPGNDDEDDNDYEDVFIGTVPTGTSVLTVTKTISGMGSGPFDVTIEGPNGFITTTTVDEGSPTVLENIPAGTYTVTEMSPGPGWTTTYSPSQVIVLGESITAPLTPPGDITGNVFRDFNSNGVDDGVNELGVAGVTVTAYDRDGVQRGTTTTDASGVYTLTTTGNGPYRIEFTDLPAGYEPSWHGTGNGTSTQFVDAGATNVNFGINYPADYCQDNPLLCTPVHVNNNPNSPVAPLQAMLRYEYDDSGVLPSPLTIAEKSEIGSTWGVAYNRQSDTIYASAFLKRHAGLGSEGLGAIYQIAGATDSIPGSPSLFIDLAAVPGVDVGTIADNTTRGLTGAPGAPSQDPLPFGEIGKIGLGDIDISDDGSTLYVINLNQQTLLSIPINNPATLSAYPVPTDFCPAADDTRPFATAYHRGKVYVGVVCDGTSTNSRADLAAIVYEFDPVATTFTNILDFPLDYTKGQTTPTCVAGQDILTHWNPWSDDFSSSVACYDNQHSYPQPVLSDIEFDVDGSMILGFLDRWGHQTGFLNYPPGALVLENSAVNGDILRAYNNNGTFELESNGSAGPLVSSVGVGNGEGPGGGEFYDDFAAGLHHEISQGALAIHYGQGQVAYTAMDATDLVWTGGVRYLNNFDGSEDHSYLLFPANSPSLFGKANGLGDLEILCDEAPIEIGNRVWRDLNGNGVQDPGEPGIAGIEVSLQGPTTTLTTITSADGLYYFGNLRPKTTYTVTIDPAQPTLADLILTQPNAEAINGSPTSNDAILDTRDSDALNYNGLATIIYTTGSAGQNNHGLDFGYVLSNATGLVEITNVPPLGAIGNYVWVDEDSDGYQDAGEPGIPNVRVVLKDENGTVIAETRTDSQGGYLFPDLPFGDYYVDVDESTLPPGMTQTPVYPNPGADFGNQNHSGDGYPVTIGGNNPPQNMTADFGYNYNPQPDVDNPGGPVPAALGDRIWIDSDGDGVQDPQEIGVENAQVTLYHDPDGDGIYDTPYTENGYNPVDVTDANGYYLFDELPPGAYTVRVTDSSGASHDILNPGQYDQTGDPDHYAAPESTAVPGTANDHYSTVPVVLGPGDVFLNVDFGYQPVPAGPAPLGSIGDTIWLDIDADGNGPSLPPVDGGAAITQGDASGPADPSEYGIPGVTVALIRDGNGDGLWQPADEPIIATTTTDANGQYLFDDLPYGDYLVWVNDTNNVLHDLAQTYDADGLGTPNLSARTIDALEPHPRDQDFGYTPNGQTPLLGAIGDTVWFDVDGSGGDQSTQGDEPGIKGVIVNLLDDSGNIIRTTTTDENGHYYFGGLPLNETYQVVVAPENFLPAGVLEGMTNTYDPDIPLDSRGPLVTLTPTTPINLDQDFSYVYVPPTPGDPVGRIGNLVWLDPNANGIYEPHLGETPIGGVTVDLYRDLNGNGLLDAGEPLLASTVTSGVIDPANFGTDGNYIFTGLPGGDYIVDVSDRNGVLAGYWQSDGPNDGQDNNSQPDPYAVSIPTGGENLTADFGYYVDPAAVGNWVWFDTNGDGLQNDGETGINGIRVSLVITYPGGAVSTIHTTTGPDPVTGNPGWYSFGNLLLDEDYNGDGTGPEPQFEIRVTDPPGLTRTLINQGADDTLDSDDHDGVLAQPIKGQTDTNRSNDANPIASYDFAYTIVPLGAIGNYVWVDEDSDGYQDAGEPGIPNVRVVLKDENGTVIAETRTDSQGGYLFPDLPFGDYYVDVDESTLPPGMTQTPVYPNPGADFGNQNHSGDGYPVTIGGNNPPQNMTADFGYNYNPQPDVDNPGGPVPAALGDRIWIDSDGDGVQDPQEIGVENAQVTLYHDPDGDGIYDTPYTENGYNPVDVTDANGYYLFDELPPGAYTVRVTDSSGASHDILNPGQYDQTGDPDHYAAPESTAVPGTANDHYSTVPVVLGPGDVFLNVDFGYQPVPAGPAPLGSIGDTIWLDIDADGNGPSLPPVDGGAAITQGDASGPADPSEYGIPGVTVALIRDGNGDGLWQPADEPIIATTTTDANGQYLFDDLPYGDYLVWVNDTNNVLHDLAQTYDADGLGTPNLSARTIDALEPHPRDQDFGYTPNGQTPLLGAIGDTVWFDVDGSGGDQSTQGDEPGIKGVIVNLLDDSGNIIRTTTTDENGHYYFGGLPLNETYQVVVAPENFLPAGVLEGMTNTYDPDIPLDSRGPLVTLTPTTPINLDQDFSYVYVPPTPGDPVGRIGNLVWLDPNANGIYEPHLGETPIGGVTVDLYRDLNGNGLLDAGEPLLASTVTSGVIDPANFGTDGNYIFTGLPGGDYIVDVSDRNGVLAGYWQSDGPNDGQDNNSQPDPYAVSIPTGGENLTADFGYYVDPAAVGNWVWFDTNGDGLQNDGETGINGIRVSLVITYPGGAVSTIHTTTGPDPVTGNPGWYSFGNLLLDEDYNGDGTGPEPQFEIRVTDPPGLTRTLINQGADDTLDSDDHDGVLAQPIKGQTDTNRSNDANPIASYDFGYARFDLALRKSVASFSQTPLVPGGSTVTFAIEIFNQGHLPADHIVVVDYVQPGFVYDPALNPDWTQSDTLTPETTIVGPLAPGQSTTVQIVLGVAANTAGQTLENLAEIAEADNDNDPSTPPPTDVDSTPDRINDENPVKDDVIDEDGKNNPGVDDEDDHDTSSVSIGIFDLALLKQLTPNHPPVLPGSNMNFVITVVNQGTEDAYRIQVVDTLPDGSTLVDPLWVNNGNGTASLQTPIPFLAAGDSVEIFITLRVDDDYTGRSLVNYAEISEADNDQDPTNTPPVDIDSSFDSDPTNDRGGEPGGPTDNVIDNTGNDEDDHDPALVPILEGVKPVTLVSFTSRWQDGHMLIEWVTSLELETYGFRLYRSETRQFEDAVLITPEVILSQGMNGGNYQVIDTDVEPGRHYYYWLEEVGLMGDGKILERTSVAGSNMLYLPLIRK